MQIKRYLPDDHYQPVLQWLLARKAYLPTPDEMPELGYVAYNNDQPLAAGFLRRVEGGYAQLDGLVTDPRHPGESRDKAIDLVVNQLLIKAKDLGMKQVLAFSVDENTLLRACKHGFVKQPHSVIVVNLIEKA